MSLSSSDMLKFTKEEKREITLALNNVLDDLDALWAASSMESLYHYFDLKGEEWGMDDWTFIIDKEGIRIKDYPKEIILETFGRKNKRPKIKDYTEVFYFIKQYDQIRRKVESKIIRSNKEKEKGIEAIVDIKNRYEKEATIEIEVPDSINPHSLTVRQEDGKAVGELRMGAGVIRIITKGSILVNNEQSRNKVKKIGG